MKEKLEQFEKEQKRNSRNITIILFCFVLIGLILSIPWLTSKDTENPKDDLPNKIYTIANSKNPDHLKILEIAKKEGVAVNSIDVDISRQVEKNKTKLQDEEVYELISKELISIILSNRIQDRVNDTFIKANNGDKASKDLIASSVKSFEKAFSSKEEMLEYTKQLNQSLEESALENYFSSEEIEKLDNEIRQ